MLRIVLSIGGTEICHFQTWQDKAGNAPSLTATDPVTGVPVMFPDLNAGPFPTGFTAEDFQTNLIMPEPCPFISRKLPRCSVIRPTETKDIAKKENPCLVPWPNLKNINGANFQPYDLEAIRGLPEKLREVDLELYKL